MEMFDEDLIGMVNFTYETAPKQMPVMEHKVRKDNAEVNADKCVKRVAVNCQDCPFTKKRSLFDRLRDMTKWLGICGIVSMLMWWFWQNGKMDMDAAFFCIYISGCIGMFGAGWSAKR